MVVVLGQLFWEYIDGDEGREVVDEGLSKLEVFVKVEGGLISAAVGRGFIVELDLENELFCGLHLCNKIRLGIAISGLNYCGQSSTLG
jgi:hypothetical protein